MEAEELPIINVNVSGNMQVIIHNVNTQRERPSCKRNTNTSRQVGEKRVKPVLTVDRKGICNAIQ